MAQALLITMFIAFTTCSFFHLLLRWTQDVREPPALLTDLPFLSPILAMIREKSRLHVKLRDKHDLPIYTLRLPFQRMYMVNSPELIALIQKEWLEISFAALSTNIARAVGMSNKAVDIINQDMKTENNLHNRIVQVSAPQLMPGDELQGLIGRSAAVFVREVKRFEEVEGKAIKINLVSWTRQIFRKATTEAIFGPHNPYHDPAVLEACNTFETGFLALGMVPFPSVFCSRIVRARDTLVTAMTNYLRNGGHNSASKLTQMRYKLQREDYDMKVEDIARGEIGSSLAVLGNTGLVAFWLIYQIFSDHQILAEVRGELMALVIEKQDPNPGHRTSHTIALGDLRNSCPILLSTLQETMRFRSIYPAPRIVLENVQVGEYLLKKGSMLMMPTNVQHSNEEAWDNAKQFDYRRFAQSSDTGQKKIRAGFRAFGGGHELCLGRHLASAEITIFAALVVLQYDITPIQGKQWTEPAWGKSLVQPGFPIPDKEVEVELRARDPHKKWKFQLDNTKELA